VKRIIVDFAPGVETEFVDRERALRQVEEWAERSTRWPVVIFGPEGCGKTAFLRQAALALREFGFDVFYLHPSTESSRLKSTTLTSRSFSSIS
jgi:Archaeal ATPase.